MARMKIFNTLEEDAFESPPVFNSAERKRFFSLPLLLEDSMVNLRTPINKVCFLVVAGYFKARRKFFARQFHQTDIEYVARQIGVNPSEVFIESYSKETYARHQRAILSYFGYSPFDEVAKTIITNEIAALIRVQFRPRPCKNVQNIPGKSKFLLETRFLALFTSSWWVINLLSGSHGFFLSKRELCLEGCKNA